MLLDALSLFALFKGIHPEVFSILLYCPLSRGEGTMVLEEGLRQKKRQGSSLLFGGQNLFKFLPLFCTIYVQKDDFEE